MAQALSTDKSYKYNSMQTLVHRDCHQLPKPHMGAHALSLDNILFEFFKTVGLPEPRSQRHFPPKHSNIDIHHNLQDLSLVLQGRHRGFLFVKTKRKKFDVHVQYRSNIIPYNSTQTS
jgi:hypothetical protein